MLLALAGLAIFGTAGAAVDFEPGDLASFTLNGGHASNLAISMNAGLGAGSGLVSSATASGAFVTDSAVYARGASLAAGETYTASMFYRMALQGTGPDIRLGFLAGPSGVFGNALVANAWFETFGTGELKSWHYGWTRGLVRELAGPYMPRDHWYRLQVGLSSADLLNFSLAVSLDDYGDDGTAFAGNVLDQVFAFRDADLGGASTLYAGFYAHGATTAFDAFDFANVGVVPVPAGAWLVVSALAALGAVRTGRPLRADAPAARARDRRKVG
ncbi:MAG: hypothetical protein KDK06_06930 [Gammaproteobacteria bacterium]|nr:hypothetical protein [Gammaproteobacteria bacterium]